VLGKDSCQIRNQAVLTKRGEHDDEGQNPEGSTAQCGGNRYTRDCGAIVRHNGIRPVAPSMMLDRPLSKWRDENRADAAAGKCQRKGKTPALVKPREHSVVGPENQHGMRTGAADDVLEAALVHDLCEGKF
jgi:hypothetical protein